MSNKALSRLSKSGLEGVQVEIAQEKAASLGRAATRLQNALSRLRAHEQTPAPDDEANTERKRFVGEAGEALWYYVVQREACGLRDVEFVLREFQVPREVYLRMGRASVFRTESQEARTMR